MASGKTSPTPNHPLIVAFDIGTSSTRALLYDARGRAQAGREVQIKYHQTFTPDGGVETDPDRLLADTLKALKQLLAKCTPDEKSRIAAVATSTFWHALMGIDAHGKAATPLFSWADTRSSAEVERLIDGGLEPRAYHGRTGAFVHSSYWPAKIAWLRHAQPHIADRVACWISFADYLMLRVSGRLMTSLSVASGTGLLNEAACGWDEETLKILSIDPAKLPKIARRGETFRLQDKRLAPGLPDVPWYPAYGDGACSNIGAGGIDDTRVVINLSTSGAIRVLCGQPTGSEVPEGLFRYRLDEDRWVIGGAVSNGGNVYAWLNRTLQLPEPNVLERDLLRAAPDSHGLTVLPFWAGERSPGWHAVATAALVGLNLSTSPLNLAQASLEAVAYTLRTLRGDILSAFPVATQIIVSGGAVEHSKYMPQLFANVLNAPVRMSLDSEPSGRGAALAVAEQIGGLRGSLKNAPDRLSRPILPDPAAAAVYDRAHRRFATLYDMLIGRPLAEPTSKTEDILQNP